MPWHDSWTAMRAGKKQQKQPKEREPMDWDISVQEPEQAAPESTERMDLPEGIHDLQIKTVAEDATQLVLELTHEDRRYWWVKLTLKKGQTWARVLVPQLAGALALSEQEWAETQSAALTGRRVRAEIRHRAGDNGRVFVNVWKFLPIEQLEQEAAAKRPARTPAAKVKATSPAIGSDDIPFLWLVAIIASVIGGGA